MSLALSRDDLILEAMPLVKWQARRFPKLPPGIDVDDLESVGHEALIEAAVTYDPAGGITFSTHARTTVRGRMQSAITAARTRSRRHVPLEIEMEDGDRMPRVDVRASDPGDRAAARETLMYPSREISRQGVTQDAPGVAEVAFRAAVLREAMFASIGTKDAADIVAAVINKAKKGDLMAAKLFFDLLSPGRTGTVVVNQQMITVSPEDL